MLFFGTQLVHTQLIPGVWHTEHKGFDLLQLHAHGTGGDKDSEDTSYESDNSRVEADEDSQEEEENTYAEGERNQFYHDSSGSEGYEQFYEASDEEEVVSEACAFAWRRRWKGWGGGGKDAASTKKGARAGNADILKFLTSDDAGGAGAVERGGHDGRRVRGGQGGGDRRWRGGGRHREEETMEIEDDAEVVEEEGVRPARDSKRGGRAGQVEILESRVYRHFVQ